MGRPNQPRDRRGRWTTTGAGARLGSQRQDFARALQHQGSAGDNSGRSTVYAYLRDKDSPSGKAGSPYYVGVAGDVRRPYVSHGRTPVPSDERRIRMLRQNVTHEQAREWEKYYIQKYGRRDIGTGRKMLINHTDGGDGVANIPAKTRAKLAAAARNMSPETRAKLAAAARNMSAEQRAKMSEAHRGRVKSPETRAKLAEAARNRPPDANARMAATRIRNAAAKHGVDLRLWSAMSRNQRQNSTTNAKKQGLTVAQYIEKMRSKWGV